MEQLDEPLGVEALERICSTISPMLPRNKHFLLLVLGEGTTRLEMSGDIPPELTVPVLEWGIRVADGSEEDTSNV